MLLKKIDTFDEKSSLKLELYFYAILRACVLNEILVVTRRKAANAFEVFLKFVHLRTRVSLYHSFSAQLGLRCFFLVNKAKNKAFIH